MRIKLMTSFHDDKETFIEVEASLIVIVVGCLALMAWWLFG